MERPTSDAEIREACPGIRTWLYRDLARLEETGEFPQLPIAVLYETMPGFGHWVGLLPTADGSVEHFDSYGLRPDAELKWVPKKYREAFRADAPHMVRLLARLQDEHDVPVSYSEFRLQGRKPWIATCGRWVVWRCQNMGLTAAQFAKATRQMARSVGMTPDDFVVKMVPLLGDSASAVVSPLGLGFVASGGRRRRSR